MKKIFHGHLKDKATQSYRITTSCNIFLSVVITLNQLGSKFFQCLIGKKMV